MCWTIQGKTILGHVTRESGATSLGHDFAPYRAKVSSLIRTGGEPDAA